MSNVITLLLFVLFIQSSSETAYQFTEYNKKSEICEYSPLLNNSLHCQAEFSNLRREPYIPRVVTTNNNTFSLNFAIKFGTNFEFPPRQSKNGNQYCLLLPDGIFGRRVYVNQLDSYLHRTRGIVLDFYTWYDNDVERVMNVKNRHMLTLKVIMEHLNRSLSACGSPLQFHPRPEDRDIDFAVITSFEKLDKFKTADLFHSREQCQLGFSAVRKQDSFFVLIALVKPIGWRAFLATGVLIPILTLCIFLYHKISEKLLLSKGKIRNSNSTPKMSNIFGFLIRAHIDQCVDNNRTASSVGRKMNLRCLYMSWLFYCLLLNTTFKSNLIQELMKPAATISAETFQELLADSRPFVGFDGGNGQLCDIPKVLANEAIKHLENAGGMQHIFQGLSLRYKRRGIRDVTDILDGKLNMFDEIPILRTMFQILERKYGIQHYKIANAALTNDVFWAVKRNRVQSQRILETLGIMASSGIIDFFRMQQRMVDLVTAQKVMQAFFSGYFEAKRAQEEDDDEKDDDDDSEEGKLLKCMAVYNSMQDRIRSLGFGFSRGSEPITLKNFLALWILLMTGFLLACISFLGESIAYIKHSKIDVMDYGLYIK